jgi:hypothetical protein
MPSSPLPHSPNTGSGPRVPPVSKALGLLAVAFGCGLAGLTLAGAISGYAAIGIFDLTIGGMFLAFSYQSAKFGMDVTAGRQSLAGHTLR